MVNKAYDNYPVIYVDWNQAKAYCEWANGGKDGLPSEAQWEKAARGPNSNKYPWGNQAPDSSYANYNQNIGDTTEAGSYEKGASPYGAMDMAGNVWEWVNDWYADKYDQTDISNPQGPNSGSYRVLRGGRWFNSSRLIRAAYRYYNLPSNRYSGIGFRCFSSP